MEITLSSVYSNWEDHSAFYSKEEIPAIASVSYGKEDRNEKVARKALVKVWTRILEKYARPGVFIPSVSEVYKELLDEGVKAAVQAIVDDNFFVRPGMIRKEVKAKVEKGLQSFDLVAFVDSVRIAQHDPNVFFQLKEEIRQHVLFDRF